MNRAQPAPQAGKHETRQNYPHFLKIPSRWMDNDIYGHVNNVVYYSYVDTVVNDYLIRRGGLDIHHGAVIGVAIESHCNFYRPLVFPQIVDAGLRVGHLGDTSVRYEVGLFGDDCEPVCATAHFVHVFVDRAARRPTAIPENLRQCLAEIAVVRA